MSIVHTTNQILISTVLYMLIQKSISYVHFSNILPLSYFRLIKESWPLGSGTFLFVILYKKAIVARIGCAN